MSSYFASIGETAGGRMALFKSSTTATVLVQMFTLAEKPLVPVVPFWIIIMIYGVGAINIAVKLCGRGKRAFELWMHLQAITAGALVGFTVANGILADTDLFADIPYAKEPCNYAAAFAGFAVVGCMVLCKNTNNQTGALLAGLLFLYQPLPEIWEVFSHPAAGADFNLTYIYCNMVGSVLGLSRCIYIWNKIWLTLEWWAVVVKGMIISVAILVANERLSVPFLNPFSRDFLTNFNIVILLYVVLNFAFLPRRKPISGAPD
jgi:hypothetical protein